MSEGNVSFLRNCLLRSLKRRSGCSIGKTRIELRLGRTWSTIPLVWVKPTRRVELSLRDESVVTLMVPPTAAMSSQCGASSLLRVSAEH